MYINLYPIDSSMWRRKRSTNCHHSEGCNSARYFTSCNCFKRGPTITLEFGSVLNDPGATAIDDTSGMVEVTASNTNPERFRSQQIVYKAVDAAGNSNRVTRQLIVQDTAPPEINLVGDASVTIVLGEAFF